MVFVGKVEGSNPSLTAKLQKTDLMVGFFVLGAATISVLAIHWQRPRRKTGPFAYQGPVCRIAAASLSLIAQASFNIGICSQLSQCVR